MDNQAVLRFDISDTGIGIKDEDREKLLGDFLRFDNRRNQGIEGTGLGLAISRNLCRLMGGDITVESIYREGSTFTITIPQTVVEAASIARVKSLKTKSVLLYERWKLYEKSIEWSPANLGAPAVKAAKGELPPRLEKERPSFVFVSPGMAAAVLNFIREKMLNTTMVLLVNFEDNGVFQHRPALTIPAHTVSITNILNGVQEEAKKEGREQALPPPRRNIINLREKSAKSWYPEQGEYETVGGDRTIQASDSLAGRRSNQKAGPATGGHRPMDAQAGATAC